MPPKKQQIRVKRPVSSTSKRAAPSPSEITSIIAGESKTTSEPAVSLSPKPRPVTASPVRSIQLNELVLQQNEHHNCSIVRDGDVIVTQNRDNETLIGNSELEVDRDDVNMDVDVNVSGGDVEEEGEKKVVKKKKTKVVKVVKKVVRVVKKRVPVRKGGALVASDVQNSGGGVLLPMQEREIDRCDDNVVEKRGKFESLASREVEDYCVGQELVGGEVGGSGMQGSVFMEEREVDECVDGVVEGSREFERLVSSPTVVGNDGVEQALDVEDAEQSRLASISVEVENLETVKACEMGEQEGILEKCESFADMVEEREASGEHENRNREEVAVEDDGDMASGGIALSRELEAMERRKRRKTEIFIGGLHLSAKEEDLRKVFEDVGEVVEVRLVLNFNTGKNRGFAFVRFASAADAKKALEKYPKLEVNNKLSFLFCGFKSLSCIL